MYKSEFLWYYLPVSNTPLFPNYILGVDKLSSFKPNHVFSEADFWVTSSNDAPHDDSLMDWMAAEPVENFDDLRVRFHRESDTLLFGGDNFVEVCNLLHDYELYKTAQQ